MYWTIHVLDHTCTMSRTTSNDDEEENGSSIFTQCETLPQLRPMIRLGVDRCPHTGMQATGIPPHLAISAKVNDFIDKIEGLEAKVNEQSQYMETTLPKNLSTQVVDDLRQNFQLL